MVDYQEMNNYSDNEDYEDEIQLESLKMISKAGFGKTSEIYKCICRNSDQNQEKYYAIKLLKQNQSNKIQLKNEVNFFQNVLEHPHIINSINYDQKYDCLILEYMENGELFEYIKVSNNSFPPNLARYYFQQLFQALYHIHKSKFIHLDIKLENLLLNEQFELKLSDFGTAQQIEAYNDIQYLKIGTKGYMSPQIYYDEPYCGEKADIYSMGIVLFNMIIGCKPIFNNNNNSEEIGENEETNEDHYNEEEALFTFYKEGKEEELWDLIESSLKRNFDYRLITLLNGMLCYEEDDRWSLIDIIKCEWFNNNDIMSDDKRIEYMSMLKKQIQIEEDCN